MKSSDPSRRFRTLLRPTRSNEKGEQVIGFGIRIGYWPCIRAPFIQFAFWKWNLDVWYGLPTLLTSA